MTTAEKIAEEIFRCIERERRILKSDLVEAAERILKMEAPPPVGLEPGWRAPSTVNKVTIGGGGSGGNAVQPYPVIYGYNNVTWVGGI